MKENISSFECAKKENESKKETEEVADNDARIRGKLVDFPGYPSLRKYILEFLLLYFLAKLKSIILKLPVLSLWLMERTTT